MADQTGTETDEDLIGTAEGETLTALGGNDRLVGLGGDDTLDGGEGFDRADYSEGEAAGGASGVTVDLAAGTAVDGFGDADALIGIELVRGSAFADTLTGGGDDFFEMFSGLAGDDTIDGGSGFDRLDYSDHADFGGAGGVTLDLAAGTATDPFGDTDTVAGIEEVNATAQDDSLTGGDAGFERFRGLAGDDVIAGGVGTDQVAYDDDADFGGTAGVTVDLAAGTATDGFGDTDTLSGIEEVRGSAFADSLTGRGDESENFEGLAGDDTIDGGAGGLDRADYSDDASQGGTAGVTVDLAAGTATDGFGDADTLVGIERVRATQFADTLAGDDGDNIFTGLAGDDAFDGRAGFDQVSYSFAVNRGGAAGVTVDLAAGTAVDPFGDADTLTGIGGVTGTNADDTLTGGGNDAFELLEGLGGNDVIDGGSGFDLVDYNDEAAFGGTAGVTVDLAAGTATDGFGDADTLIGIEAVRATRFDDTLTGAGADFEFFRGLAGNDVIDGGEGVDEADYSFDDNRGGTLGVTVDLAAGTATDGFGDADTLTSIEDARGTDFADSLTGDDGANTLGGEGGDDTLTGGLGDDTLRGGDGEDTAVIAGDAAEATATDLGDAVQVVSADGSDRLEGIEFVRFDDQTLTVAELLALTPPETISGDDGPNDLVGTEAAEILEGLGGDDTLTGLGGDDTLEGGLGSDTYFHNAGDGVDRVIQTTGDGASQDTADLGSGFDLNWAFDGDDLLIAIAVDENYDLADSGALRLVDHLSGAVDPLDFLVADTDFNDFYTSPAEHPGELARIFTHVGLTGTDQGGYTELVVGTAGDDVMSGGGGFRDYLYGRDGDDILTGDDATFDELRGGAGDDTLRALGGDDRGLRGDAGDDVIDGGAGSDRIRYDSSPAGVTVNLSDAAFDGVAAGTAADGFGDIDTLISIERVRGSDFGDSLIGGDGAETLDGEAGDDTLVGGRGDDTLRGGDGEDTAVIAGDAAEATATDLGDATEIVSADGTDRLRSVEFVQFDDLLLSVADLLAAPPPEQTGGAGDDVLDGGEAGDRLIGLGGSDRLFGGAGDDLMEGGEGDDFLRGDAGADILDGGAGNDALFAGPSDDLGDTLRGGDGDDVMGGGPGDDDIAGGAGADVAFGGDGDDVISEVGDTASNTVWAGDGEDEIAGGDGNDVLGGGLGGDAISAGGGDDTVYGGLGDGADDIDGGAGDDTLFGGGGDDAISGGDGNDVIYNGSSNDTVGGGAGDDEIWGAPGDDVLTGAAGADVFGFVAGNGSDSITDFEDGLDTILIEGAATSFAELDVAASGADTAVSFADVSVTLQGVDPGAIDADDFTFV